MTENENNDRSILYGASYVLPGMFYGGLGFPGGVTAGVGYPLTGVYPGGYPMGTYPGAGYPLGAYPGGVTAGVGYPQTGVYPGGYPAGTYPGIGPTGVYPGAGYPSTGTYPGMGYVPGAGYRESVPKRAAGIPAIPAIPAPGVPAAGGVPPVVSGAIITPSGTTFTPPAIEESYIENILRLNLGKVATIYMTFENNKEWNAKIFRGVLEAAGRDHIIISDPKTGIRYLLLMVNLDYITFDQQLKYAYPVPAPVPAPLSREED